MNSLLFNEQAGVALFELLLVLAIGGSLILGSMQTMHSLRLQRQTTKAAQSVQAVLFAAASNFQDEPSVEGLLAEKKLRAKQLKNDFLDNFILSYQQHPARITCLARMHQVPADQQAALALKLGAHVHHAGELEWQTTPSAVLQPISHFWMLQGNLHKYVQRVTIHEASI